MGCGSSSVNTKYEKNKFSHTKTDYDENIIKSQSEKNIIESNNRKQENQEPIISINNETCNVNQRKTSDLYFSTFENYDLLERFLKYDRAKSFYEKYKQNYFFSPGDEEFYENLFEEIKPEFDELFNRYDINYSIRNEDFEVDVRTYKLKCKACKKNNTDIYLIIFFLEFLLYPKSYIKKSKVKSVIFIDHLDFWTPQYVQYRAACPEYNSTESLYYCTKEKSTSYISLVIHHEFFHYVDWTDDFTYDDQTWRTFNCEGFSYGQGGAYEREWVPLNPECKGFLNHYSTTGIEEDKAEIFQNLMRFPHEAFNNEDNIIAKKSFYLKDWLKKYDNQGFGKTNFFETLVMYRKTNFI
jgi:hypothetical protein